MPAQRATAHGRELAGSGLHPRLAHMLVKAREHRRGAPGLRPRGHLERARRPARDAAARATSICGCAWRSLRGDVRDLPPGITHRCARALAGEAQLRRWQRDFMRGSADAARSSTSATGHPAGVRLSRPHRAAPRRRRPLSAWPTAAARASPNRRRWPKPSSSSRRNSTAPSARRGFSLPRRCAARISSGISRRRSTISAEIRWDEREQRGPRAARTASGGAGAGLGGHPRSRRQTRAAAPRSPASAARHRGAPLDARNCGSGRRVSS